MAEEPSRPASERRIDALITAIADEHLRALAVGLLLALDQLETTDFGELEPVGVASPTWWR
jgi:hypothetical protein